MDTWNGRIGQANPADEASLRSWLTDNGVTGYPQMMLVVMTPPVKEGGFSEEAPCSNSGFSANGPG